MDLLPVILVLVIAYLAGSIPTAVWTGKIFFGIDVREHGSGNAGATNTIRVLGWKSGIPVMIVDIGKGVVATMLPLFFKMGEPGSVAIINLQIAAGLAAIMGHVFPLFAGFRGGKGVATTFGVLLALSPLLTASTIIVFLLVLIITKYVSLSSMTAGIMFPAMLFLVFPTPSLIFRIFSVVVALGLIATHRKNIKRLLRGEEPKFYFKKRGGSQ